MSKISNLTISFPHLSSVRSRVLESIDLSGSKGESKARKVSSTSAASTGGMCTLRVAAKADKKARKVSSSELVVFGRRANA